MLFSATVVTYDKDILSPVDCNTAYPLALPKVVLGHAFKR